MQVYTCFFEKFVSDTLMFPYILLLILFLFLIFFEKILLKRKSIFLVAILLVIFASIRSYEVGTDSPGYTSYFRFYVDYYFSDINQTLEIGYRAFLYLLLNFFEDYFWLFFFSSIIVIPCYLYSIKQLSRNYVLSLYLYVTLGFYTFFFNGLRQGIAMAISSIALMYMLKKDLFRFSIIIFIASLFHVSSLIMFAFYLIVNIKIKLEYKFFTVLTFSALSSSYLVGLLAENNERYEHYTQLSDNSGGYLTLLFHSVMALIIYYYLRTKFDNDYFYKKMTIFYICGIALVLPVSLLGTDPSGPQRILFYFTFSLVFLLPMIIKEIKNILYYIIFFVVTFVYYMLTTFKLGGLDPYILNPNFILL